MHRAASRSSLRIDRWGVAAHSRDFIVVTFADGRTTPHRNYPEPFTLREGAAGFGFENLRVFLDLCLGQAMAFADSDCT